MKPTPKEIRKLHDWLKKEMPFVFSGFQQQWEIRKEEKCPSQGVLWVNRDYVQNAEDLTEIVNEALLLHPHISKIEMYSFVDDEVYAKLGILGQHCLILKECVLEILKDLQFTIDTNANNLSVNITQKSTNKTTILSYPYRQISENFKKALGIIFSHVISLKPTANDSKAVENIYGILDEDTKLMVQELLNTEFGNAFIHEEKEYYLNPFACYLKDNFPEYGIPMWLLQDGYTSSYEKIIKDNENFMSYLNFSEIRQYAPITLKEYQEYKESEENSKIVITKKFYLSEWDNCWMDSESEVYIGGKLILINKKSEIEKKIKEEKINDKITVEINDIAGEADIKKFGKVVIGHVFRYLSDEDKNKHKDIIERDEYFWLFSIQRLATLILELDDSKNDQINKTWRQHSGEEQLTLSSIESLKTLKGMPFDRIKKLAGRIEGSSTHCHNGINKTKLSIIIGILLDFIEKHLESWADITIQFLERYSVTCPDNIKGIQQTNHLSGVLLRLNRNINDAKIRKAYIDDILSTYQSITEPYVKDLITQFIYKRTDSVSPLSEESKHATDSITNYDQSGAIKQTIYEEVANME